MKEIIKYIVIITCAASVIYFAAKQDSTAADKAGCEAFIYISNNSMFEIDLTIDGFPSGNLMIGKNKTYKVELAGDNPKKLKVKATYLDPDYIEPKAITYITKNRMECGMIDTMYIAFTK